MVDESDEDVHVEPSAEDLAALAKLIPISTSTDVVVDEEVDINPIDTEEPEEFEYKLFSGSAPTKVNIAEPVAEEYATPVRPESYYFHTPIPSDVLEAVVLTGEQVLAASTVPWKDRSQVIVVPQHQAVTKKRWRPSMARRQKFKAMKAAEEELARKRLELRSIGRNRGRGRGHAGRGAAAGVNRVVHKVMKEKKAGPIGYPRKGAPAL